MTEKTINDSDKNHTYYASDETNKIKVVSFDAAFVVFTPFCHYVEKKHWVHSFNTFNLNNLKIIELEPIFNFVNINSLFLKGIKSLTIKDKLNNNSLFTCHIESTDLTCWQQLDVILKPNKVDNNLATTGQKYTGKIWIKQNNKGVIYVLYKNKLNHTMLAKSVKFTRDDWIIQTLDQHDAQIIDMTVTTSGKLKVILNISENNFNNITDFVKKPKFEISPKNPFYEEFDFKVKFLNSFVE
ncbi:MAG: hypothetical protein HRU38_02455 [Saccharospirillaceae bacterium]|nr:hypothetical protein [Pseudomonadales bacterium]NRB77522.1 hypothetical protein [Saccharospirillaceae bacterium]